MSVWGDTDFCCCCRPTRRRCGVSSLCRWLPTIVLGCGAVAATVVAVIFFILAAQQKRQHRPLAMSELALHDARYDCWLAIYDQVFDLTDYQHPGGQDYILDYCGVDATESFSVMHTASLLELVHPKFVGILVREGDGRSFSDKERTDNKKPLPSSPQSPPGRPIMGPPSTAARPPPPVAQQTLEPTRTPPVRRQTLEPTFRSAKVTTLPPVLTQTLDPTAVPVATNKIQTPSPSTPPFGNRPESGSGFPFIWDISLVNASQLEAHSDADDCWVQYYGSVYNMTAYTDLHPGGETTITGFCGKNATIAFAAEHSVDDLGLIKEYLVGFYDTGDNSDDSDKLATSTESSPTTPPLPMPSATLPPAFSLITILTPAPSPLSSQTTPAPSAMNPVPTLDPLSILVPESTGSPVSTSTTSTPTVAPVPLTPKLVVTTTEPTDMPTVGVVLLPEPRAPSPPSTFSISATETSRPTPFFTVASQITFASPTSRPQTNSPTAARVPAITTLPTKNPMLQPSTNAPVSIAPTPSLRTASPVPLPTESPTDRPVTLAPTTASPTLRPSSPPVTKSPTMAQQRAPTPRPTMISTSAGTAPLPESGCFRLADNATLTDVCWYIFYGTVLDLITYMDSNLEGPDRVSFVCGAEATNEVFQTATAGNTEETFLFRRVGDDLTIGHVCSSR